MLKPLRPALGTPRLSVRRLDWCWVSTLPLFCLLVFFFAKVALLGLVCAPLGFPHSSPFPCLLLSTHPPVAGVLLVRRLDWLPPPYPLYCPLFISDRTCEGPSYPVSLTADWPGILWEITYRP